ncbi:MAG: TonB-dependent receptor [Acidobacteria bacterium]|nr:TonB-dependent receptor [Acidobacteriota bacterium]MBI3423828.1 TonB-dependent receptor [Acidobacteriota bacterium]
MRSPVSILALIERRPRLHNLLPCTFAFVLFFQTVALYAQGGLELSGRVTDAQGAAVTNATITVYARANHARVNAVTDSQGGYHFARLSSGAYLLTVEAAGFARAVHTVTVEGKTTQLDLQLNTAGINDGVIVTATGTPQAVDEVSKSVSTISAAEIEQRNEFSLAEALRLTPGLRVQQNGGPQAFTAIKTRGLRNEDTAILLDGFRFRDASSIAGDALSFISDLLVVNPNSVEVLRGSGSSLYGTNAIGGVINVVSDEGGGAPHGQVQLEGGQLGLFRTRATLAGGFNENRFVYSAGLAHLNVASGLDGNDAARNTSAQGFARYQLTPAATLSGRLYASKVFAQLNDSPFNAPTANLPASGIIKAIPLALAQQRLFETGRTYNLGNATFFPDLNDPDYRRQAGYFSGALRFNHALNSRLSYELSYNSLLTARAFRDGPQGVRFEPQFNNRSGFDARIDTVNARFDLLANRLNQFTGGYEFEREAFDNPTEDENPNPAQRVNARTKVSQRSHALFVQDQLRLLGQRLQISLAFRAQHFQLARPDFFGGAPVFTNASFPAPPNAYTGDGSIAYFIKTSGTKLRAHVGNGYRAPSLYERFGSGFFGGSFSAYGDPRLRPDRSIAVDGGVDQSFLAGRVKASATYFYTRLQEVTFFDFSGFINPATDPFGRFGGYRNTGGGLARGVELSVQAKPTRTTDVQFSYTYTNSDQRRPSSVAGFIPAFGISAQQFSAYMNHRVGKRMDVTFDLFAANRYFLALGFPSRAFQFDGPVKADLGASYTLPVGNDRSWRFYGKVDNVLNRVYFESGFRTPPAQFSGGASYRF